MGEEEQSELFKKVFTNTLRKLAEEPEELFDNDKLRKKYNNLLRKQIKLKQENKQLKSQLQQKENIIKEAREKVDNFDVFKEFTFPLMKRDEEQQVKSSIDYEWRKSIKEPILEILEKVEENK